MKPLRQVGSRAEERWGGRERRARVRRAAVTDERCVAAAAGASSRTGPVARRSRGVRRRRRVAWTTRSGDNGKNRFSGVGDRQFLRYIDYVLLLGPSSFLSSPSPTHLLSTPALLRATLPLSPSHPASVIPRAAPGFRHRLSFASSFFALLLLPTGTTSGRLPLLSATLLSSLRSSG